MTFIYVVGYYDPASEKFHHVVAFGDRTKAELYVTKHRTVDRLLKVIMVKFYD